MPAATVESEIVREMPASRPTAASARASASSTAGSRQSTSAGHSTTTSTPITPPNSASTRARAWEAGAPDGSESMIRVSASRPEPTNARAAVREQATTTSGRACRTDNAARTFATRPASGEDRPSRRPLQNRVEAISGVSRVTAMKLARAPMAAAIPKVRTASILATASEAKPIAVTMLVRPQAMPMRRMAPDEAASGSIPRRALRRMSSMKWIESQVPTTRASDGTTLVRMLTGAPNRPRVPRAQIAPMNGGRLATTVDRRLRATTAESITANTRPIELNISMSWRSARVACSRSAGRPVNSSASGPSAGADSASTASIRATTADDAGGRSAVADSCTSSSDDDASAESRWPATRGCPLARALARASDSASSGSDVRGITGSTTPAVPCRRMSKMLRTSSTPSIPRSLPARSSNAVSDSASKMSPDRAAARTMQSRSGGPKTSAISSTRSSWALPSRTSACRSSSNRRREMPKAARAVSVAASSQPASRQS